jgi:hypothetical protein
VSAPRRALGGRHALCTMVLVLAASCGTPSLPGPPLAAHVTADLVAIDAPPPPARVEEIPPRPRGVEAVWLDGEWVLRGSRFRWRRGRWAERVPGLAFAPWSVVRAEDGRLFMAPGKWIDAQGKTVDPPRTLVEAEASRALVVGGTGEEENVGRDLRDNRDGGAGPLRERNDAGVR